VANDSGVQPGWYADPLRRFELRYFNGAAWTADVANGGARFVDPHGVDVHPVHRPATGPPPDTSGANGPATASMVLGIIAVSIAWLPFIVVLGIIAASLALVFAALGIRRSAPSGVGRSRSIVGLVTGASALVVAVLGVVLSIVVLDVYDAYVDPPPHEVAITSCELVGSRAIATGTLEHSGTDDTDFSVLIGFVRPGTDNPHRTARVALDGVAPGRPAEFEAERQVDLDDVGCIVIEVTGPLPFGLDLD
jgi:hypothetical protein